MVPDVLFWMTASSLWEATAGAWYSIFLQIRQDDFILKNYIKRLVTFYIFVNKSREKTNDDRRYNQCFSV